MVSTESHSDDIDSLVAYELSRRAACVFVAATFPASSQVDLA